MEKRAVVEPGRTPKEHLFPSTEKTAVVEKQVRRELIESLDADFTKRAAEQVTRTVCSPQ